MIHTLISLNADLASSIALRYSCRLMDLADMRLQPIHVEEVDKEGYQPGSGWVRSTWERGLLQTAQEEISQLVNAEKSGCHFLDASIMRIGDREDELLKEIEENAYDLLLEGVLNSFDAQLFHKKVRSKLYRYAPCPIILVKNLVNPDRVALLLQEMADVNPVVSAFQKLFAKSKMTVDLVFYSQIKHRMEAEKRKLDETPPADQQQVDLRPGAQIIGEAARRLADFGWTPREKWIVLDEARKIGEFAGDYGLVCSHIPRHTLKKNLALEVLSRVPTATLICR